MESVFQNLGLLGMTELKHGLSIKLENGKEIFDQRSSSNPTLTRRVVLYEGQIPKTVYSFQGTQNSVSVGPNTNENQVVMEMQTVYDEGDPLNPDKIVFTKAVRIVNPDTPSVVSTSSIAAMLASTCFLTKFPQNILLLGNSANVLPGYFFHITPHMSIDVVDPCSASQNIATTIAPVTVPEGVPPPEFVVTPPSHPLNLALRDGELESANNMLTTLNGVLGMRYYHYNITPDVFFDDLKLDNDIDVGSETSKSLPIELQESANMPTRQYNMILHDIDATPSYSTPQLLCQIHDALDPNGIYVRRITLPFGAAFDPEAVSQNAIIDFENPQEIASALRSTFRAVYWSQPSIDTVILVGVKSNFFNGRRSHPLSEEALVDNAVVMLEGKAMTLEVLEKTDQFSYLYADDNINEMLVYDPAHFDDSRVEMEE